VLWRSPNNVKKNIIYCLCSYLPQDDIIQKNLTPVIEDLKKWAEYKNADFKLITKIPDKIEDMFISIKQFYSDKEISKYKCIKYEEYASELQRLKAWNTKFYLIHEFYKSNYDKMLYFDCDVIVRHKDRFKFEDYNKAFYMYLRREEIKTADPIVIPEKYLNREIPGRFAAGLIFICKDLQTNLTDVFAYDKIYNLWQKDDHFIREETAMTYIIHNEQVPTTYINFPLIHIGCDSVKKEYIHEEFRAN